METKTDGMWYRVVERTPPNADADVGVDPYWHIRLRPEGWMGRDLVVLVARGCEEPWSPGSLHVIPPQRPAAWREAGLLV